MNYYERIQKSIDYIESNLENEIDLNLAAREAFMSMSNFYRMFFALVGHSLKEYVRLRRFSLAAADLMERDSCIIDVAVKYGFESGDAFSRAFRRITGFLPSEFRKKDQRFHFERMSIMDKYFDIQDKKLLEQYPDIKILKEMKPTRVAYYCYFGKDPETNAFNIMKEWLNRSGLDTSESDFRVFGYNNPSPSSPDQTEYGYEVCVTISEDVEVNDELVGVKTLEGGLYAVIGVKRKDDSELGYEIMLAWQRFNNWLKDSKYIYGGHQWLEEHLGFDETFQHIGGVDLYMPIADRDSIDTTKSFEKVEPMLIATYTATGRSAAEAARQYLLKWAEGEGLFCSEKSHRFFAYYNNERIGYDDFFFKMCVTVEQNFHSEDQNIRLEEFPGGDYLFMRSKYKNNGMAWSEFITWVSKDKEYDFGNYTFFEEYLIDKPSVDMETDMILHMPVKKKK